jgi:hypothetical protein
MVRTYPAQENLQIHTQSQPDRLKYEHDTILNYMSRSSLNVFDVGAVLLRSIFWTLSIVPMFFNDG